MATELRVFGTLAEAVRYTSHYERTHQDAYVAELDQVVRVLNVDAPALDEARRRLDAGKKLVDRRMGWFVGQSIPRLRENTSPQFVRACFTGGAARIGITGWPAALDVLCTPQAIRALVPGTPQWETATAKARMLLAVVPGVFDMPYPPGFRPFWQHPAFCEHVCK